MNRITTIYYQTLKKINILTRKRKERKRQLKNLLKPTCFDGALIGSKVIQDLADLM